MNVQQRCFYLSKLSAVFNSCAIGGKEYLWTRRCDGNPSEAESEIILNFRPSLETFSAVATSFSDDPNSKSSSSSSSYYAILETDTVIEADQITKAGGCRQTA
jgi:hypothetical protein